jgi:hypothetical protein
LILAASRDSLPAPGGFAGGNGTAMRTVSFLVSFESALRRCKSVSKIAENHSPVTC